MNKVITARNKNVGAIRNVISTVTRLNFANSIMETNHASHDLTPPANYNDATCDVVVSLAGFSLGYAADDHHIARIMVDVGVSGGSTVNLPLKAEAFASFKDHNADDSWNGWVDVVVQYILR